MLVDREICKQLKRTIIILGLLGVVLATFLSSLSYGIGAGWYAVYKDNKFIPLGQNPFQDMALRYCFVSVFYLISMVLVWFPTRQFGKILAIVPLILAIHQVYILTSFGPGNIPVWITEYSIGLSNLSYGPLFFILFSILNIALQIALIATAIIKKH